MELKPDELKAAMGDDKKMSELVEKLNASFVSPMQMLTDEMEKYKTEDVAILCFPSGEKVTVLPSNKILVIRKDWVNEGFVTLDELIKVMNEKSTEFTSWDEMKKLHGIQE